MPLLALTPMSLKTVAESRAEYHLIRPMRMPRARHFTMHTPAMAMSALEAEGAAIRPALPNDAERLTLDARMANLTGAWAEVEHVTDHYVNAGSPIAPSPDVRALVSSQWLAFGQELVACCIPREVADKWHRLDGWPWPRAIGPIARHAAGMAFSAARSSRDWYGSAPAGTPKIDRAAAVARRLDLWDTPPPSHTYAVTTSAGKEVGRVHFWQSNRSGYRAVAVEGTARRWFSNKPEEIPSEQRPVRDPDGSGRYYTLTHFAALAAGLADATRQEAIEFSGRSFQGIVAPTFPAWYPDRILYQDVLGLSYSGNSRSRLGGLDVFFANTVANVMNTLETNVWLPLSGSNR